MQRIGIASGLILYGSASRILVRWKGQFFLAINSQIGQIRTKNEEKR
jgi:hypothetical protein